MGAPAPLTESLGPYAPVVEEALDRLVADRVVGRLWDRDHTLWGPDPDEIANRLGWLDAPRAAAGRLEPIDRLVADARADALSHAVLMGMGGSSLAPEVFQREFGPDHDGLDLEVLDTTDPAWIVERARAIDPARTLFLVSSKSGTTIETLSLFKLFHRRTGEALDAAAAVERFVAITDPGSRLAETGGELGFRVVFLADPEVGGRYSAFTEFGLVPAALVGVDVRRLLERGRDAAERCESEDPRQNPGARLGAALGALHAAGRDKLTLVLPPRIASFGAWIEQLIAESTGKDGRGILPVLEAPPEPGVVGDDRLVVHFRLADDPIHDAPVERLAEAGHPVVRIDLADRYDLGGQIFLWEFATAVAGIVMGIHPFDQPNVESAKARAREMIDAWRETGELPAPDPVTVDGGIEVHGDVAADDLAGALESFLAGAEPPDYVAVLAFLPPRPDVAAALERLREVLRDRLRVAVTAAFGPRYLHSTGQLHKGDAGRGRFLLITAKPEADLPIPDEPGSGSAALSFGVLERAQALGDAEALREAGRSVLRLHLRDPSPATLERLAAAVGHDR